MLVDVRPRLLKPAFGAVQLDRGHPLARNLVVQYTLNEGGSLPLDGTAKPGGSVTSMTGLPWKGAASGIALSSDGTATNSFNSGTLNSGFRLAATDPFTLEVMVRLTGTASLAQLWGLGINPNAVATSGSRRQILAFGGVSPFNIYFWGENADLDSGVLWRTDGSLQHVFITSDGTTMRFYRDGKQIASGTTPAGLIAGTRQAWGFSHHPSGLTTMVGQMFKASFRDAALTAGEVASLTAEPYAFLQPIPAVRYWSTPSAAAALSVYGSATPDPGLHAPILRRVA